MSDVKKPKLSRLIELQSFLHNFHHIERVVHFSKSSDRRETDTEHSYSLAISAWFIAQYFPELDLNLCIRYALVHDLVEIYAGDTYVFAEKELLNSKKQREHEAIERIKKDWPDFKSLTTDIQEYEKLDSPDSCFVYALDKIMPNLVIFLGEGRTWQEYNISLQDLKKAKEEKVKKSPQIYHYYQAMMNMLEDFPEYFPKKP